MPVGEFDETAGFDAAPEQPDDAEFAATSEFADESEFVGESEFADTPDIGADTDSDADSVASSGSVEPPAGPADAGAGPVEWQPRPRPARPPMRPDFRARSGGYQDRRPAGPVGAAPWTARTPLGPPPSDIIGPDEELIAGRHPVEEAFIAHRKAIRLLVVPQRRLALEKLVLHATNLRIPIVEVEGGTLTSWAGFDGHQGIALVTDKRKFAGLDDILARAIERKEAPFVLVLDSLEDPQNFGSLLRTAEATGVHGVIYPVRHQAPLSAAAVKASAGAVEHLLLVPVEDLAEALTDLHVRGLRVIGSDADAPLTARQADLRGPVVIVVGSEGQGLGPAVRRRCDTVVRIPMRGHIESLNAAVAGSILLYEASSQRGGEKPLVGPEPGTEPVSFAPESVDEEPVVVAEALPAALAEALPAAEPAPAAEAVAATEPAADPAPKAKAKRRATAKPAAGEAPLATDDEALLPGAPASAPPNTDPAE
jgi:23S rRNA (guanosine2251-2'-O)-methyltransferase